MATRQDRSRAQQKLAREVRSGQYRPSPQLNKARRAQTALRTPASWSVNKTQDFTRLDEAEKFARALPPDVQSYILAEGEVLRPDKYQDKSIAWAALNLWSDRTSYTAQDTAAITAKRRSVFDDNPLRYRVVFR